MSVTFAQRRWGSVMRWSPDELRSLRAEYGETQCVFAARLRVAVQTLRSWESGRCVVPRVVQCLMDRLREDIDNGSPRPHPDAKLTYGPG